MKRSGSTLEPIETQDENQASEPLAIRKEPRREAFDTRQWLEARNSKVGSSWVNGDWAERRTRRTLH
jgi:hypothetical protein